MITIAIDDPKLEARLRALAHARGEDVSNFAVAALAEALADEMTDEDKARLHEGILRGLEAERAGRTRPAHEFFAEMEAKYGLPGQ